MHRRSSVGWTVSLVVAGLLSTFLSAAPASADGISYFLTTSNLLPTFTGPFVEVDISRTSTTQADVTFKSLTNGVITYLISGNQLADLNTNGLVTSTTGIKFTQLSGFALPTLGQTCPGGTCPQQVDGFGKFNYVLEDTAAPGGFKSALTSLTFTISHTTPDWNSVTDVLTGISGSIAAAHIFACTGNAITPCTQAAGALATGFADNATAAVPEPGTLVLLGSALAGLGAWTRRRLNGR